MIEESSFNLRLKNPIEVYGEDQPVSNLVFRECGAGYDKFYLKLRRYVVSAQLNSVDMLNKFREFGEDERPKSGAEVKPLHALKDGEFSQEVEDGVAFLQFVLGAGEEMEQLVDVFGRMVAHQGGDGICHTEGGNRVQQGAWDRVGIEDKIEAATRYCSFFGIGLDNQRKQGSDPAPASPSLVKEL